MSDYGEFSFGDQGDWSTGLGGGGNNSIVQFLRTLSPGIEVELQYDCQPPACGTFQGFSQGNVLLSNYNGFPGLVRIAPNRINAVAPIDICCIDY